MTVFMRNNGFDLIRINFKHLLFFLDQSLWFSRPSGRGFLIRHGSCIGFGRACRFLLGEGDFGTDLVKGRSIFPIQI